MAAFAKFCGASIASAACSPAGATERGIAFGKNDRPGIMLAGAVRTYLNRFGVTCGKRVAVYTNNDDGWRTAQICISPASNSQP